MPKKSKITAEPITFALRHAEAGLPVEDLCRKLGVSPVTFFRWKAKYGQMGAVEVRRLRQLEEREQDAQAVGRRPQSGQEDVAGRASKKALRPPVRRERVADLVARYGAGRRQVCQALRFPRATEDYKRVKDPQDALRIRLRGLAAARLEYG